MFTDYKNKNIHLTRLSRFIIVRKNEKINLHIFLFFFLRLSLQFFSFPSISMKNDSVVIGTRKQNSSSDSVFSFFFSSCSRRLSILHPHCCRHRRLDKYLIPYTSKEMKKKKKTKKKKKKGKWKLIIWW